MAFRFYERPDSRSASYNPASATFEYSAEGTTDDVYVRIQSRLRTPVLYGNLWRQNITIKPAGHMLWQVTVPYGPREVHDDPGYEFTWRFDTTGGTAKITHAKEHIQSYAKSGETATDHKGAIGVNQNGDVEGTDIVIPAPKWTEDFKRLPKANFPFDYLDVLDALTGTVNNASFRGRAAGTVRFDGASGGSSSQDPEVCEFSYNFVAGRNVTNLTYGEITGVAKGAWQYLWVEYQQEEDATANKNASRPVGVHVERVYDATDFSLLRIGT